VPVGRRRIFQQVIPGRATWLLVAWCLVLAGGALWVHREFRLSADLRDFMPAPRSEAQRLLLQNIGESPASRLLLVALHGDEPAVLARLSRELSASLGDAPEMRFVSNGAGGADTFPDALLAYRYLITDAFDDAPINASVLATALSQRAEEMTSPGATLIEEMLPRDPTLETMRLASRWQAGEEPRQIDGAWFTADGQRALLVVSTVAAAFDPDGQAAAIERIRGDFVRLRGDSRAQLVLSGSGFFSATVKQQTQREAAWFGSIAAIGLMSLMWVAYRRGRYLLLGALPLLSGGLAGLALTEILFGAVHGITLAFGFTLIGVAQDYPVHLFSHLRPGDSPVRTAREVWRPLVTGVFSTCIAYLAFLLSGVQGLEQLACLTVTGLIVAALLTRFMLPQLVGQPERAVTHSALLGRLDVYMARLPRLDWLLVAIPLICGALLAFSGSGFWQNDLSRLTPIAPELLRQDAALRDELATPDPRYLLVVSGDSADDVLAGLESVERTLEELRAAGAIAAFTHAAQIVPSIGVQRRRQQALPSPESLRAMLINANEEAGFEDGVFEPFVADVDAARQALPLTAAMLDGTPLGIRLNTLLFAREGRWHGLVNFHGIREPATLAAAFAGRPDVNFLDLKSASEDLVRTQRDHILVCLALAALALVAVIFVALRSPARVLRVLAPVVLSTLVILATLRASGVQLSLFHLISLVLAAGLGLDYALFFEHAAGDAERHRRTLHALLVCAASTLMVFALLAFSSAPVLRAIGITVALGVVGNFLLGLALTRERRAA
jgi:predicted exporter